MALLGGGAALSACGGESAAPAANAADQAKSEVEVFENVFACAKVTGKTREECEVMREEAIAIAEKEAPRFEAIQDCEAQYGEGNCVENNFGKGEQTEGRRSYSGFVVAWFSRGNSNAPLFNSKAGGYQSANGSRLSYGGSPGKYVASNRALERAKSVPKVKPASKLAKRGGFGDRNGAWALADRNGGSSKAKAGAAGSGGKARSKGG